MLLFDRPRMPLLRRLELIEIESMPDMDLSIMWCALSNLESLTIRACKIEEFCLEGHPKIATLVVESCDRLRAVRVSGCDKLATVSMQWSAVRSLVLDCPLLEQISTTGCRFDQLTVHSNTIKSLVGLSVCWSPYSVGTLDLACLDLTTLHIAKSLYLDNTTLAAILRSCGQLETLTLAGCERVTALEIPTRVVELRLSLRHLRSLSTTGVQLEVLSLDDVPLSKETRATLLAAHVRVSCFYQHCRLRFKMLALSDGTLVGQRACYTTSHLSGGKGGGGGVGFLITTFHHFPPNCRQTRCVS
jgi:hypothetical protein